VQKLKLSDVLMLDIPSKAGWRSKFTFAKFYDKRSCKKTPLPICSEVMLHSGWTFFHLPCASVFDVSRDPSVGDKS